MEAVRVYKKEDLLEAFEIGMNNQITTCLWLSKKNN
jgi:hypothetical protein